MVEATARRTGRRTLFALVAAVSLSAAVAGCSSSTSPAAGDTPGATGTASAGTSAHATGASVSVKEKEYSLTLSQTAFTAGTYTFVASDGGQVTHALAIAGPGLSTTQTNPINPGGSASLTVTLQPGSYELWCPIDDHKAMGMDTHITVGTASVSTSTSAAHMVQ